MEEEPKCMQYLSCELAMGSYSDPVTFLYFFSFPNDFPKGTLGFNSRGKNNSVSLQGSSRCIAFCERQDGIPHLVVLSLFIGRCKECSSTLLPGSYKPGSEAGTFVCMQHRGKLAVSGKAERRPSPDRQSPELRTETEADSMGENALQAAAEVGKGDGDSQESAAETPTPAEGPAGPAEKDSTASKAETPTPPAQAGSGAPVSQTPPRPPIPSKPAGLTQDKVSTLDGRLRDSRPTPAPRKATDVSALSPPSSHPVPRPRSTLQGEGSECGPGMVNGKRALWWQGLPSTSSVAEVVG